MSSDRGRVTRLVRYPVKACGGEPLDSCEVAVDGLRNDRVLAVAVGDRIVTQRELPVLAAVRQGLDDTTARLDLSFPGTPTAPVRRSLLRAGPQLHAIAVCCAKLSAPSPTVGDVAVADG